MPPRKSHLGELERAVLEVLWRASAPRTVREVYDELATARDLAYTTVMTVLDRLAKKALVIQERDDRAYRYRAAASRSEMTAELMREALDEFATADRRPALVAFVGDASEEERAALREALAALDG